MRNEKVAEEIEVENCEDCPCYSCAYDLEGNEIPGSCEWRDVSGVAPREGVPGGCWLRNGILIVRMKEKANDE
ncbi:MAG: hypothetical protein U9Q07_04010 [Planctomycetota bacterium]|nr:hypothetical protein [Planctomycetota bacterium]